MPTLDNRYDLADLIYSDAAVAAYNAHDRLLNRAVTIELLQGEGAVNPAYAAQLVEKGRVAALTSLPNVAAVYDQHAVDGRPFLVLEEVAGPALGSVAPLPLEQTVTLVCELAATVQTALKRDQPLPVLNEDTVRIGMDDRIQVLDFGLQQRRPTAEQALAALGGLLQTALGGHMSAQQSRPVREIAERALRGEYTTAEALSADLRGLLQRADQPTTVLGRVPATVPIDDADRGGRSAPVAQEPAAARRIPLPWMLGLGALLLVVALGSLLLNRAGGADVSSGASTAPSALASAPGASTPPNASAAPAGEPYIVAARGSGTVRVRNGPGLGATQIASLPNGTEVQVISQPQAADGYNWVRINGGGVDGWCILEALRKQ